MENLVNVIQNLTKPAVLKKDGVGMRKVTVIVQHVLITQKSGDQMVDVVPTSLLPLEDLVNVIQKQMVMKKVLAVLIKDGVEIVQLTVIVQHALITQKVLLVVAHLVMVY